MFSTCYELAYPEDFCFNHNLDAIGNILLLHCFCICRMWLAFQLHKVSALLPLVQYLVQRFHVAAPESGAFPDFVEVAAVERPTSHHYSHYLRLEAIVHSDEHGCLNVPLSNNSVVELVSCSGHVQFGWVCL